MKATVQIEMGESSCAASVESTCKFCVRNADDSYYCLLFKNSMREVRGWPMRASDCIAKFG